MTITDYMEMFFVAKKIEGLSKKSLNFYKLEITGMAKFLGPRKIDEITTDDIRRYLANCVEKKNISKTTLDNKRRVLNSFFSWLEDEEHIPKNPVKRIKKVRQEKLILKPLSEEEMERLRDAAETERDLAIINVLVSTGMRIGEMVPLNCSDVDFRNGEIIVFGKGQKERMVYLNAKAKVSLQKYLSSRKDDNPALFVAHQGSSPKRLEGGGIRFMLKKLSSKTGISNVHPHRFRRTAATIAIGRGMPIEQVQEMLGHSSIETTTRYAIVNIKNVKSSHAKYLS